MTRLYIFAEGSTEQTFADTIIKPHLALHNVFMNKPVLIAHRKKRGRVHRGGGRNYLPMKNDILRFLKQDNNPDVYFTTMIDLYAIHTDFPGLTDSSSLQSDPMRRVKFLEEKFASDIGDYRFIPYLQLHEFEACLFADPSCFRSLYDNCDREVDELITIAANFASPEMINDGQHSAPSKRIINVFPAYDYAKSTDGPQLAKIIGLSSIRKKCEHFDNWLTGLESLNQVL